MTPKTTDLPSPSINSVNRLVVGEDEPCGVDCVGDDRESHNDMAKYYNNAHLSDVNLIVGDEVFAAHRLILAKGSEVFDRMLSQRWNGDSKDLTVTEDPSTVRYFPAFLRFLYSNHIVLHHENVLPVLILADKYNVASLRKVCVDFAVSSVIPHLELREIFSTWFSYATKVFHQKLIRACVDMIAARMDEVISSPEWEKIWQSIDRDQLIELLRSNSLIVRNEWSLYEAVLHWMDASGHPERRGATAAPLLSQLLPLIRFCSMSPEEISTIESSTLAKSHSKLYQPLIGQAYKVHAVSLASRARDCTSLAYLLRCYTDLRWDRRIVLRREQLERGIDHEFKLVTRSPTIPCQPWGWTLKLSTQGSFTGSNSDDTLRVYLHAESIDHPRHVEFLLSFVDDKKVVKSIVGRNQFTKSRYACELEIGERLSIRELISGESPVLNDGELHVQIMLKPLSGYEN